MLFKHGNLCRRIYRYIFNILLVLAHKSYTFLLKNIAGRGRLANKDAILKDLMKLKAFKSAA